MLSGKNFDEFLSRNLGNYDLLDRKFYFILIVYQKILENREKQNIRSGCEYNLLVKGIQREVIKFVFYNVQVLEDVEYFCLFIVL